MPGIPDLAGSFSQGYNRGVGIQQHRQARKDRKTKEEDKKVKKREERKALGEKLRGKKKKEQKEAMNKYLAIGDELVAMGKEEEGFGFYSRAYNIFPNGAQGRIISKKQNPTKYQELVAGAGEKAVKTGIPSKLRADSEYAFIDSQGATAGFKNIKEVQKVLNAGLNNEKYWKDRTKKEAADLKEEKAIAAEGRAEEIAKREEGRDEQTKIREEQRGVKAAKEKEENEPTKLEQDIAGEERLLGRSYGVDQLEERMGITTPKKPMSVGDKDRILRTAKEEYNNIYGTVDPITGGITYQEDAPAFADFRNEFEQEYYLDQDLPASGMTPEEAIQGLPDLRNQSPPVQGARKAPDGNWYVGSPEEGWSIVE